RRHTRFSRDWSSDVCSSDLAQLVENGAPHAQTGEAGKAFIRLTIAAQAVEQTQQTDLLHVFAIERGAGLQGQLTDDALDQRQVRSEERRAGKESRERWGQHA